jgi:hypothetical protein
MSESPPRDQRADGYLRNGEWVPRDAEPDPRPPGWREWLEARVRVLRGVDRRIWYAASGVLVLLVVLLVVANQGSPARAPQAQREFLDAVKRGQTAVRNGNDITLVTAARDRAARACADLPRDGSVHDWVGTLTKVGTVFGGKQGTAAVKIADGVQLHTWGRESEDGKDHTLVDPHSDVYQQLSKLLSGERVLFSGAFVPQGPVCLHETSLFARNGMLTPGFVFRFTSVTARQP